MKKLMFAMFAALSFAVLAQDAEAVKPDAKEGRRGPRDRAAMMAERGGRPRMGMDGMMGDPVLASLMNPKVAEKVGASEEVREKIKKLDLEHREKVRDLQAKLRVAMEKQAGLMKAETTDEAAVMAAIDEVFDCRKELAKAQVKRTISVKALFTPEQIAKANEAMKELREERMGKRKVPAEAAAKPECEGCDKKAE